jgi:hypothetical protein
MDFREALQAGKIGIGGASDHWTRLFAQKVLGGYVQGYAEGAIASFTDGVNDPVDKLLVAITPVQTGTGDPSPDNVRPISGWDGCTVYRSGADTSNPTTYPITFPSEAGTVYGGELDVTSGVLTVDRAMVDLGTLTWSMISDPGVFFTLNVPAHETTAPICTKYAGANPVQSNTGAYNKGNNTTCFRISGDLRLYVRDDSYTSVETFAESLAGVQLVYELATPLTYQLTPTEVTTLLGTNNIWADTGDVKVWYKKKR